MATPGQHRKRSGRVTPKGGGRNRLSAAERESYDELFARLLVDARRYLSDDLDPLEVEMWASHLWSVWEGNALVGGDQVAVFGGGLIAYCAARRTPAALRVLHAMAAVAPAPYGPKARRAANRLVEAGVAPPSWASMVGAGAATCAWLTFDSIDDDGVSVMVGFDGPYGRHTLGVYIDHNLGGMAKDAFGLPHPIEEVLARLHESDEAEPVEYKEISVVEAAGRWRDAFNMTDMTVDAPVSEDLCYMRALLLARLSRLPAGGAVPAPEEVDEDERLQLIEEFLVSDEAAGLWLDDGDDSGDVELFASQAMTFSLDYVSGTPLRFSPVMVEIFCLDWAPRKIAASAEAFEGLPDVLAAWLRFIGRRRGIPEASIDEAVEAVDACAAEMIDLANDPATWGPAKTLGLAVAEGGIDLTDRAAVDRFIDEVNANGGIDVLADSLAARRASSG